MRKMVSYPPPPVNYTKQELTKSVDFLPLVESLFIAGLWGMESRGECVRGAVEPIQVRHISYGGLNHSGSGRVAFG